MGVGALNSALNAFKASTLLTELLPQFLDVIFYAEDPRKFGISIEALGWENPPFSWAFEYLVFSLWHYLWRLRNYGHIGGSALLGVSGENLKACIVSTSLSAISTTILAGCHGTVNPK